MRPVVPKKELHCHLPKTSIRFSMDSFPESRQLDLLLRQMGREERLQFGHHGNSITTLKRVAAVFELETGNRPAGFQR
jgi:hypothetical protein